MEKECLAEALPWDLISVKHFCVYICNVFFYEADDGVGFYSGLLLGNFPQ